MGSSTLHTKRVRELAISMDLYRLATIEFGKDPKISYFAQSLAFALKTRVWKGNK